MPSDAKILREQGLEALRAHWREKARRRLRTGSPPTNCQDCGATLVPSGRGRYQRRCGPCRKASHNSSRLTRAQKERKNQLARKRALQHRQSVICPCGRTFLRTLGARSYCQPSHSKIGWSVPLAFAPCVECEQPFVQRRGRRFCSETHTNRYLSREYQRETHATAKRYWRIADTSEARDLAELYYTLRQELRRW